MATSGHLWAVGYEDIGRANEVRDTIVSLGWDKHFPHPRGCGGRRPTSRWLVHPRPRAVPCRIEHPGLHRRGLPGWPLPGAAIGAVVGGAGTALSARAGIGDDFVREVQGLMKPGTSALFVLDSEGDMDVILHALRGLGGTVLRTNVDLERAQLIQSTLAAAPGSGEEARRMTAAKLPRW